MNTYLILKRWEQMLVFSDPKLAHALSKGEASLEFL